MKLQTILSGLISLMLLFFSSSAQAQFTQLQQGLGCYGYYPGNDISGINQSPFRLPNTTLSCKDISLAYGLNGAPNSAYYFRSPEDHCVLKNVPQSHLQAVSLKFISDGRNPGTLIGMESGGFKIRLADNGKLDVTLAVSPQIAYHFQSDQGLIDGKWHHVVINFSGKSLAVWLDGQLLKSDDSNKNFQEIHYQSKDLFLGYLPGEYSYFNGRIQDVLLYNRPLTSLEIKALGLTLPPLFSQHHSTGLIFQADFNNRRIANVAPAKMIDTEGEYPFNGLMPGKQANSYDEAAKLNGHDGVVTIDRVMNEENFTVSLDFSTVGKTTAPILMRTAGELGVTINADSLDGTLSLVNSAGTVFANGTTNVADGRWHRLTLVVKDSSATLFLDGQLEATSTSPIKLTMGSTKLSIGADPPRNAFFDGLVDNISVWNRALSLSEHRAVTGVARTQAGNIFSCREYPNSEKKVLFVGSNDRQNIRLEIKDNKGNIILKRTTLSPGEFRVKTVTTDCPCSLLKPVSP